MAALEGRAAALASQKTAAEARLAQLAALEPEYLRLKRERDALESSAGTFAAREQTERARTELAQRSVDNISIYEAARTPTRGDSMKRIIVIAAAILRPHDRACHRPPARLVRHRLRNRRFCRTHARPAYPCRHAGALMKRPAPRSRRSLPRAWPRPRAQRAAAWSCSCPRVRERAPPA
jgi:hypothetical protein